MKKRIVQALFAAIISGMLALAGTAALGQPGPQSSSVSTVIGS
jgi:hypothetical protein